MVHGSVFNAPRGRKLNYNTVLLRTHSELVYYTVFITIIDNVVVDSSSISKVY